MSVELEEARKKLAVFQKECDDYLVVIVQQKREADDQAKVKKQMNIIFEFIFISLLCKRKNESKLTKQNV